jgi:outer membrane protein OmpA-like peptidoglycan-associated protein
MRCNWRRWLWGIIPLLVLSWVAVQAEHSRLERDLAERARLALVEGGFTWAQAEFKARDALLMGRAPREGEPGKAADALAAVWGVRVVDNKADLLDKAEKYVWTASRRNNRIRLSGYAPSIDTRRAILGVTKASFPGFEIVDRTTLARGSPSSDVWLAGVSFALKQLTAIKRGDVRLEDLGLTVTGQAEDVSAYRTIKQALANSVPKGISVTADLVTAPVASPYMWAAHSADGRLVLSGHVPNDAVRADLVAAAKEGLPRAAIVDQMQPGEGAPQGWVDIAVAILREMGRLQGGGADMKDATLVVSGLAADAATAEAIRATLRAAVPATIKLTDQIQVKEPAPPALPPPSVVPRERSETPANGPEAASSARTDTAAQSTPPPSVVPTERPETPAKGPGVASPARTDTAAQSAPPVAPPVEGPALLRARACKEQLASVAAAGHILFRLASAELESTSFQTLDKLAEAAKSCPGMRIEVGGHASSEGSAELNQRLSLRRAQSVVAYLVHAGVDVAQLEPIGHGAAQPVAPNDGSQNMARNRRIEFTVRPK